MDQKVDLKHYELFIDGKQVAPSTGEYTIDLDPATEEPIAEVAQGGKADVDKAVSSARAALKIWGALRAAEWLPGRPAGLYGMEHVLGL